MVKVSIDQDKCVGCGTCTFLCVEVFELDKTSEKAQITHEFRLENTSTGEVPKSHKCIIVAKNKCPVFAIKIEEK